jgi:predicted kinase
MKTLYVMVGLPGTGKSTLVNSLIRDGVFVYSTDALIEEWSAAMGYTYNFGFDKYIQKATRQMDAELLIAIDENRDIIWDQTSTTLGSRRKKFAMLPNYHAVAVVFATPEPPELERRLASRPGKNIPWNVMQGMISGFKMPTEDEGFDEIWYAD